MSNKGRAKLVSKSFVETEVELAEVLATEEGAALVLARPGDSGNRYLTVVLPWEDFEALRALERPAPKAGN